MLARFATRGSRLIALILIGLSIGAYFWIKELEPKRDLLWLQFIGYEWFDASSARAAVDGLDVKSADDKLEIWRRLGMRWTYPMHAVAGRIGALIGGQSRLTAFGFGMAFPFLMGYALFVIVAVYVGEFESISLTSAVFALTALLPGPAPTDHLLYYESPLKNIVNLVVLLLNPGGAFNPLSIQPKSTILLFAIGAFALRRAGQLRLAYVLLALGIMWHAHLSIVLLGMLLAWDLVLWRSVQGRLFWLHERDDALGFSVLCAVLAVASAVLYWMVRSDSTWGIESALIQFSARLLLVAECVGLSYVLFRSWDWVRNRVDAGVLSLLFVVPLWFVAGLSMFAATGAIWEQGRYVSAKLYDDGYIGRTYGDVALYYGRALRKMRGD